jgi:hypothetical protein
MVIPNEAKNCHPERSEGSWLDSSITQTDETNRERACTPRAIPSEARPRTVIPSKARDPGLIPESRKPMRPTANVSTPTAS